MIGGPHKSRIGTIWSPPPVGTLRFNVGSATRGKLGPTYIGGFHRTRHGPHLWSSQSQWVEEIQMRPNY